ncbi:hypothetical protein MW887_009082 [Aspergillus wentii]|nr:hypothetical protein MW887_009082 [Aspergillus wentii]
MESSNVDANKDVSFSGDFDQIFPLDSLSSECGDLSPTVSTAKHPPQSSPQPWGKDLWALQEDASSSAEQQDFSFHDTVHPSAITDPSPALETPASHPAQVAPVQRPSKSPSTPPATPSRKATRNPLVTPKSIRRRDPNERRGLLRKQSYSPSLMRSSQLQKSRMAYPEAWAQRFQDFGLRGSDDHLPLSPPPSDFVQRQNFQPDNYPQQQQNRSDGLPPADSTEMPHQYDTTIFNQSPAISMPSPSAGALARQQQRYLSNSALTTSSPPSDDIFSPHSSAPQSMSSWHSDSFSTPALFTPDLNSQDAQAWWSPMASRVAQRPSYQPMVASSAPQRPIQNTNQQNDMMQGGLMIQFDPSFDMSATSTESSFPSTTMPSAPTNQESHSYQVPPTAPKFIESSFTTAPQVQNPQRSPSLSPRTGVSPKNGSTTRNNINMKAQQRRTHNPKLSSHTMSAPKPVKATGGSSGSPRGSNKSSVTVSFVNFTANDSRKILGGVAPSGSSKTKARREQEARDRRRKLSEAALDAVRRSGGDVEALEAVLC